MMERKIVSVLSGVPERSLTLTDSAAARLRALLPIFRQVEAEKGIPWYLLAGIAWRESDFVTNAVNPTSGAAGLMQVMPFHFSRLNWSRPHTVQGTRGTGGTGWNDPLKNVRAGADILVSSGYKSKGLQKTLANYGGFVTKDPTDYIRYVLGRSTVLMIADKTGGI